MNPWIVWAWIVTVGSVAGLGTTLAWIVLRSHQLDSPQDGQGTAEHDAAFSFARYKVMERLLSLDDARFLCSQQGFSPAAVGRWKRDSRRIFRMYLRALTRDFFTLHARARQLVVESHTESPVFASTLVRQQAAFWRARVSLEGRLILFTLGVGSVDVAPLLEMIEAMRLDLLRLVPSSVQAA